MVLLSLGQAWANSCAGMTPVAVRIDAKNVQRAAVPRTIFGFDMPWYDAQIAYFRNGRIRDEIVEWLRPFDGAMYRYSAGSATFDWRRAVGPVPDRMKNWDQYAMGGWAVTEFGPEEFLQFVQRVRGAPLWMINLQGLRERPWTPDELVNGGRDYAQWVGRRASQVCAASAPCSRQAFELGNEMDWEPYLWPGSVYVNRAQPVASAIRSVMPDAVILAQGQTAPWDPKSKKSGRSSFDVTVAQAMARDVDGVTIHPYYDGHDIPYLSGYLDRLADTYKRAGKEVPVYVTEHGRWPSMPPSGRWEDRWHEASGSGGGVAAADFVLAMMSRPHVQAAMWHELGAQGPWQLFRWQRNGDSVYPSAVYWALRTVRDAFLEDVVEVQPSMIKGGDYRGGYAVRLIAMRDRQGRLSLLGVNRSSSPVLLDVATTARREGARRISRFVADEFGSDTPTDDPDRFKPLVEKAAPGKSPLCLEGRAVFTVNWQ
jgi:hypothetical protein